MPPGFGGECLTKPYVIVCDKDGIDVIPSSWVDLQTKCMSMPPKRDYDRFRRSNVPPQSTWSTNPLLKIYDGEYDTFEEADAKVKVYEGRPTETTDESDEPTHLPKPPINIDKKISLPTSSRTNKAGKQGQTGLRILKPNKRCADGEPFVSNVKVRKPMRPKSSHIDLMKNTVSSRQIVPVSVSPKQSDIIVSGDYNISPAFTTTDISTLISNINVMIGNQKQFQDSVLSHLTRLDKRTQKIEEMVKNICNSNPDTAMQAVIASPFSDDSVEIDDEIKEVKSFLPLFTATDVKAFSDYLMIHENAAKHRKALVRFYKKSGILLGPERRFKLILSKLFDKTITIGYTWHGIISTIPNGGSKDSLRDTAPVLILIEFMRRLPAVTKLSADDFSKEKNKWGQTWVATARDSQARKDSTRPKIRKVTITRTPVDKIKSILPETPTHDTPSTSDPISIHTRLPPRPNFDSKSPDQTKNDANITAIDVTGDETIDDAFGSFLQMRYDRNISDNTQQELPPQEDIEEDDYRSHISDSD